MEAMIEKIIATEKAKKVYEGFALWNNGSMWHAETASNRCSARTPRKALEGLLKRVKQ